MVVTTAADLYTPEALVASIVNDRARSLAVMLQTPAVMVVDSAEVWNGGTGETVTLRTFTTDTSGIVQDAVRNSRTGVTPDKLTMSSYQETVKNKTISIDGDSFAFTDAGLNETGQHLAEVGSEGVSKAYQDSLILNAMETDLELDVTGESDKTLTVKSILRAKMKWGEWASNIPNPILFVHSNQYEDLAETESFERLASAANNAIVKSSEEAGASPIVAVVHGVGIVCLDSIRNSLGAPAITSITRSGTTATVTTASAHGLLPGEKVDISGTVLAYDGTKEILAVPSATTFTFTVTGSPPTPATGDPVFIPLYHGLMCAPGSLKLFPKKEPAIEMVPHAGSTVKTFDMHFRFASTLERRRPRPVVRLVTR